MLDTWKSVAALLAGALLFAAGPRAVSTFESIGLYWNRAAAKEGCAVRYRPAGAAEWRQGYPLVYDAREREYRGSLVGLQPDTAYQIRLEAGGEQAAWGRHHFEFSAM